MNTYSTTQTTNFTAFAGLIVILAGKFGLELQAEDIAVAIGAMVTLYGIVANYIHRYNKGDVTLGGARK